MLHDDSGQASDYATGTKAVFSTGPKSRRDTGLLGHRALLSRSRAVEKFLYSSINVAKEHRALILREIGSTSHVNSSIGEHFHCSRWIINSCF
jgi:hypothetical protein